MVASCSRCGRDHGRELEAAEAEEAAKERAR
jgi:hypothetical protein